MTWPLEQVKEECAVLLRREGRSEIYVRAVERHADMLAKIGVRDLADDGLQAKVRLYLDLPTHEKHRRHDSAQAAGSTVQVRYGYLRALVGHAMRYMGMVQDPLVGFVMPAKARRAAIARTDEQEVYTLDEVRATLALDRREDPVWLAFLIACYTGLRAFELYALKWDQIDWESRTLRVSKGKGSKVRTVPLQPDLYEYLNHLGGKAAKRPRLGVVCVIESPRLAVQQHLRPLLDLAGVKWDRGASDITGLPRRLTWHACRRTCAAASLAAGVDSVEIQRALGHEDLSLTGAYAGAFTRWKHQVQVEGWPRGQLCFFGNGNKKRVAGAATPG